MRAVLQTIGGNAWFVILDLDEVFHDAACKLGYQPVYGGFGSPCPPDSPHVHRAFANFQRSVEPMILQAAGRQPVPWDRALFDLLRRIEGTSIDWWLLGGAALAVRGLDVSPGDIDLVVADDAMTRVEDLLLDHVIQPVVQTPGWVHNSFARAFLHCRVEWVGGVCSLADDPDISDQGPYAQDHLETVRWHGHEIRIPPLALQLEVCRRRGLTERVRIIESAM